MVDAAARRASTASHAGPSGPRRRRVGSGSRMAPTEAWHAGRTMRILELLAFGSLSVPQLAEALHAHPRTVRRVLAQLLEDEYVTVTDDGRRTYAPTMRLVALAGQIVDGSPLARRGRPYVALA